MAKSKKTRGAGRGDDYDVGYGKPPKSSQFKPGQSGNPGGRKRGSLNLRTIYSQVYGEMMDLAINGKKRSVSGLEAMVFREFQLGMTGNGRVIHHVLNRFERFCAAEPSAVIEEISEDDRALIERGIRRLGSTDAAASDQAMNAPSYEDDPKVDDGLVDD